MKVSLRDVMSEQLVDKLEKESTACFDVEEDDEDEDLKLALQLSLEEEERRHHALRDEEESAVAAVQPEEYDEDYLLALALQEEEEQNSRMIEDELFARQIARQQQENSQNRKVLVSYTREDTGSGDYFPLLDDSDDDDEDDLPLVTNHNDPLNPFSGRALIKHNNSFVSKHDVGICGQRNAQNISKFGEIGRDADDIKIPTKSYNILKKHFREEKKSRIRENERSDMSTAERAMDKRTRLLVFKLMASGVLEEVNGIVNTGKEANVYHAVGNMEKVNEALQESGRSLSLMDSGPTFDVAIKIFKTTLNEFRNRKLYIEGDVRFPSQLTKQNPRKIIKIWAEKELRNLNRLHRCGILCPQPLFLRKHVLLMSFVGSGGWPAPCLVDADISSAAASLLYRQCAGIMRRMFQDAHLVHADLSPHNLLLHNRALCVIDVSQAVDRSGPNALLFLKRDCASITEFFRKKNVSCGTLMQLFDFIVDQYLAADKEQATLDEMMEAASVRSAEEEEAIRSDEAVFVKSHMPGSLKEVPLEDAIQLKCKSESGNLRDVFCQTITGMSPDMAGPSPS